MQAPTFYKVVHETEYLYQRNVSLSQQLLHMTPRGFAYQDCLRHQILIEPLAGECTNRLDYFGNPTQNVCITRPHNRLHVVAESNVVLRPRLNEAQIIGSPAWEEKRDKLQRTRHMALREVAQYTYPSPHVPCNAELATYALQSFTPGKPLLEAAFDLTRRIFAEFEFDNSATTISTPINEVLRGRRGVCQDFAHLMLGCMRSLGLACRYVSGYILTTPPPGHERLIGADASHAWVSVFCSGYGWVDFDPTNHCLVQDEHITLAWGRDFSDVTPMRGVILGGGEQELLVRVTVTPLSEGTDSG